MEIGSLVRLKPSNPFARHRPELPGRIGRVGGLRIADGRKMVTVAYHTSGALPYEVSAELFEVVAS